MDLEVLGSEGVVWGAMEGWISDLGIWEALGLVAWLLRAPVSCFLCEVGRRAVPLCDGSRAVTVWTPEAWV